MADDDDNLSIEVTEKFREQVNALTPAERKLARRLIDEVDMPKEPEPDFSNISDIEFQKIRNSL